jgi:hypothetical protein
MILDSLKNWFIIKDLSLKILNYFILNFLFYYILLLKMLYYILLICVVKVSLIHSQVYCPLGWTMYNNAYCHKVVVTPANAFQAQQVCWSLGAYLADPTDINEFNAIKNGVVKTAWNTWGAQNVWVQECFFYH